jgi:phosphohistidine phosphatase
MRELLVLRHGKSAWDTDAPTDLERPLAKRGRKDAPRMGAWLAAHDLEPDLVVTSPARRAEETAEAVLEGTGGEGTEVRRDERIYGGELGDLLAVLGDCPARGRRVLLVGHNPGLETLVTYLASDRPRPAPNGKLMPTCAVAHFRLPDDWQGLGRSAGVLVAIARPRELHGEF